MPKILVVDDQRNMRTTLAMMLRGASYEVDEAADGAQGTDLGAKGAYDVVLTDLRMGPIDGIAVLRAVKEAQAMTEVIVMTAYGTIESAVEAMRVGAFDYIQKPFTEHELLLKVQKALDNRRLLGQVQALATEFKERYGFDNIVGRSQAIRDVLARVVKIAPTDATALITGESGTGKELIAKAIHANSRRSDRPFIPVNCAAITETLLESELFGHARGSFTGAASARKGLFEEADGGTFFFDEISETPITFQAKLLRAIQEGEIRRLGENKSIHVDVRVIAATNQDLLPAIAEKRFRQDLYYRLNVARFQLPPLRERREDIPLLVRYFVQKFAKEMQKKIGTIPTATMKGLAAWEWPGNIRELENFIERAVILTRGESLEAPLSELRKPSTGTATAPAVQPVQEDIARIVKETINAALNGKRPADEYAQKQREEIVRALADSNGRVGGADGAAARMGIHRTTLISRMKKLGIDPRQYAA